MKITGLATPNDGSLKDKKKTMMGEFLAALTSSGLEGITEDDIALSRAIKIPGQTGLVLMVKIKQDEVKDKIYAKRTRIQSGEKKLYINEDLTKEDAIKLNKARKAMREGEYLSVWTYGGKVFAKMSERGTPLCLSD